MTAVRAGVHHRRLSDRARRGCYFEHYALEAVRIHFADFPRNCLVNPSSSIASYPLPEDMGCWESVGRRPESDVRIPTITWTMPRSL
jgi:hypothetical protein